jgi:transposase
VEPCLRGQRVRPGKKGGEETGPNPTDRGRAGSKRHVLTDANGVPLALRITAANVHDSRVFEELIDAVPPVRQGRGRPCQRPDKLHADKAYDLPRCRRALRQRRIGNRIARRGIESSQRLGRYRWVVERTLAWFSRFRRLTIRYERGVDIFEAFHHIAVSLRRGPPSVKGGDERRFDPRKHRGEGKCPQTQLWAQTSSGGTDRGRSL